MCHSGIYKRCFFNSAQPHLPAASPMAWLKQNNSTLCLRCVCGWKESYFGNKLKQDMVEGQCLLTKTKAVDNVHHFWTPPSLSFPSGTAIAKQSRKAHLAGQVGGLWKHLCCRKLFCSWQSCIPEGQSVRTHSASAFSPGSRLPAWISEPQVC